MSAGVARIQCRHRQRGPVGIARRVRVAVVVGSPDRRDGTPTVVRVLGVVERDHAVGQARIEQGEHAGVLLEAVVERHARRLRDLVPHVLHGRRAPESADVRLVGAPCGAVDLAERLDLVEVGRVARAGHGRGGGGGQNWSPVSSANGRTFGQFVKTGCLKFGGVSWYSPGPDCGTNMGGVLSDPSFARAARMVVAASSPTGSPGGRAHRPRSGTASPGTSRLSPTAGSGRGT